MLKTNVEGLKDKDWLDFSSLSLYMRCPRAYQWRHIQNITSATEKTALINGEAYHEGKATFYRQLLARASHEDAKEQALRAMIPIMRRITVEDSKRNLSVALQTMANYCDYWRDDPFRTLDIEIAFAVDLINFLYVGKIDRYVEGEGFGKLVEETKTTTIVGNRWPDRLKPNAQIDGYIAAIYILTDELPAGGVLDIIPVTEKLNQKPFRHITTRNVQDMEAWYKNTTAIWEHIQMCKENSFFPMHTENCTPILGYSCEYTLLCRLHPELKEGLEIPGEYIVEEWAPLPELLKGTPASKEALE